VKTKERGIADDQWIMNCKGCRKQWLWPKLSYFLHIYLEVLRNLIEHLSECSLYFGLGTNQAYPEFKSEASPFTQYTIASQII
jgi:hypothetical protein